MRCSGVQVSWHSKFSVRNVVCRQISFPVIALPAQTSPTVEMAQGITSIPFLKTMQ